MKVACPGISTPSQSCWALVFDKSRALERQNADEDRAREGEAQRGREGKGKMTDPLNVHCGLGNLREQTIRKI